MSKVNGTPTIIAVGDVGASSNTCTDGRKGNWKLWIIGAVFLLALWSMFAGSITLEWAGSHLIRSRTNGDLQFSEEIDILEVEEKEKVVRHLWDLYSNGRKMPKFWAEAFSAAYEDLQSGSPSVRDHAIHEIAKFSILSYQNSTTLAAKDSSYDAV